MENSGTHACYHDRQETKSRGGDTPPPASLVGGVSAWVRQLHIRGREARPTRLGASGPVQLTGATTQNCCSRILLEMEGCGLLFVREGGKGKKGMGSEGPQIATASPLRTLTHKRQTATPPYP